MENDGDWDDGYAAGVARCEEEIKALEGKLEGALLTVDAILRDYRGISTEQVGVRLRALIAAYSVVPTGDSK